MSLITIPDEARDPDEGKDPDEGGGQRVIQVYFPCKNLDDKDISLKIFIY